MNTFVAGDERAGAEREDCSGRKHLQFVNKTVLVQMGETGKKID